MRNLINLFNEVFDNRFDKFNSEMTSIENLIKQEQLAIKYENYEKASILRDKIEKMKNKDY